MSKVAFKEAERLPFGHIVTKKPKYITPAGKRTPEKGRRPERKTGGGYSGRLLILCPKCGTMKGFYTQNNLRQYICNTCGERTPLENLKRAYFNCECGARHRYMTNVYAKLFEVDCFNCGRPMQAEWSKKHCCYQSI
jgi:hypothetical protein